MILARIYTGKVYSRLKLKILRYQLPYVLGVHGGRCRPCPILNDYTFSSKGENGRLSLDATIFARRIKNTPKWSVFVP